MDYSVRPAKHVSRKMMCEVFKRLTHFDSLKLYEYVGFGAKELIDFSVFHKTLGLGKMTSIEMDEEIYQRARTYNLPYGCITPIHGKSTDVLPGLSYSARTIYWLDYVSVLDKVVLADVAIICEKARSGSVLVVTVNSDLRHDRLAMVKSSVGDENIPLRTEETSLNGWGAGNLFKKILRNKVDEILRLRNLGNSDPIFAEDILHMHYRDGARMLTYGTVLYAKSEKAKLAGCKFRELPFARGEEFLLKVPELTRRERHILDTLLPTPGLASDEHPWLAEDFEIYRDLYRFFPNFGDVEQ